MEVLFFMTRYFFREREHIHGDRAHRMGIWFFLLMVVMLVFVAVVGANAASLNIAQTGQTTSYATGDDGAVRAGVPWPDPRFTVNSDQTITDKLTGLMWTKNAAVPTVGSCTGVSLAWPSTIITYVNCLNTAAYLGYTDWRIPNINELDSLTNLQEANVATWLNSKGFSGMAASIYWSSTTYQVLTSKAFVVDMYDGTLNSIDKSGSYYVLLVRDSGLSPYNSAYVSVSGQTSTYGGNDDGVLKKGMPWPSPRFTTSSGTVTDNLTGLTWTKDAGTPTVGSSCPGGYMSWGSALDYVACLNTAAYQGYTDWRLPNKKELLSLLNRGSFGPSLPSDHPFTNVQANAYWSSNTSAVNAGKAWTVYIYDGISPAYDKTSNNSVWAVRGGYTGSLFNLTVSTSGTGSGTVTSSPSGINCGSTCSAPFSSGASVTLTAAASDNSTFAGWGGDCSGTALTCPLTMSAAKTVTATFTQSCNYAISPTSKTFTLSAGSDTVTVTAAGGCSWTAISSAGWITVNSGSSGNGNGTVGYSVTANTEAAQRIGTITIATKTFTVTQDGTGCSYALSPTSKTFTSSSGSDNITVTTSSGCSWTAISSAGWITVNTGSSGSGSGTVAYSVAANTTISQRTGTMTIAGETFTVTQDGLSCTYSISPTSKTFTSSGGSDGVSLTTNTGCVWGASSNVDWITVNSGSYSAGSGTVGYSVAANTGTTQRTGTITIAGKTFTVTQGGACNYSITPTNKTFTSSGGSNSVAVTTDTGCTWSATSNDSWITVTSGSSGTASDNVTYSVAANTGTTQRTGTITIAGKTFTVTQGAPSDNVSFTKYDFDGDGKGDVLWRNSTTGDLYIWLMNGALIKGGDFVAKGIPDIWQVKAIGDFNGDGKSDILWQNTNSGGVYLWLMDGTIIKGGAYVVEGLPSEWEILAVADFNGDGRSDILWQNTQQGDVYIWFMDATGITGGGYMTIGIKSDWVFKAVGDFNGDGKADVLWQNKTTGDVAGWLINGLSILSTGYVAIGIPDKWKMKAVGDFDGDDKADVLWQDATTGDVAMWVLDGLKIVSGNYVVRGMPSLWQIKKTGDYNGDDKADLCWQHSTSGEVYIWLLNGSAISGGGSAAVGLTSDWQVQ
ncbi:protein containing DUF1566 [Candidatus Magnetobacterium bavaricum]|uniref:Protein containing DUF1566 n=1 Tax=Candidatus Magnetobacterium bavaricum TaxID=29290 RepID=A0A0F3H3I4_9BACT|nr:protein containing DUF1566 [Candidatus Magnetobacterium bavaricum]